MIKRLIRNAFPKLVDKIIFFKVHRYWPNVRNPRTFSEKILERKLNPVDGSSLQSDKYLVREYVADIIGSQYLIPLIKKRKLLTQDDFTDLPSQYVIKSNHASGDKHLEVVFNHSEVDINKVVEKFNHSMTLNYGVTNKEAQYLDIAPLILFEQLIGDGKTAPDDFKFHVFNNNGDIKWFLQIDIGRFGEHTRNIYDQDLQLLGLSLKFDMSDYILPDKELLLKMSSLAKNLANDNAYVRVDFYLVGEKIYFGELTFTHGGGFEKFVPKHYDLYFGNLWQKKD